MSSTIGEILAFHRKGGAIGETLRKAYEALADYDDPALLISVMPYAKALEKARAVEARADAAALPLFGVPFLVKDNIDVAGFDTTAACPAFAYRPARSAFVVARLEAAGAIAIGKTNLDQFATGLVGTRSPYGIPRNPVDARLVPGGSSSGSAVAVAAGIVPFALGTDTAGSGRVPAALNRIVGLKPSLGAISTAGVVPACRTLDAVSVFALTVDDAFAVFRAAAAYDAGEPYSRQRPVGAIGAIAPGTRIGIPAPAQRIFLGDAAAEAAFDAALSVLRAIGASLVEIDLAPFFETAKLLYDGPFLAERTAAIAAILEEQPQALLPLTRQIIAAGKTIGAVDTFEAMYRLAELRRQSEGTWQAVEALAVPTVPTLYTIEAIAADPIGRNSNLGTYTNFVNLLDLAALAAPGPDRSDGGPSSLTLVGPAGGDARLASIGRSFQAAAGARLGATGRLPPAVAPAPMLAPEGWIEIAVVGAHMRGLPLNRELVERGGVFLRAVETIPEYQLFALADGPPHRPGLLRSDRETGGAIEAEIWALPPAAFGDFVARIPPPLGIGTLHFSDATQAKGFLCEAYATAGACDITSHGGWRAYLAAAADPARDLLKY